MVKIEKLISKAKVKGSKSTTVKKIEIDSFKRGGKEFYTVLFTLMQNNTKRYRKDTFPSKDEAISSIRSILPHYRKSDETVFLDWSAVTTEQLEEFLDGDRTDEQLHALLASVDGLHLYRW